ncbi:MAG TPA: TraR/DksA family transcriptional regulator [Candidatus Latescibacteria bacterium]|nr:TraR/DksA family transcriptional regulator [Candidatus Latescibacterota bacterium]
MWSEEELRYFERLILERREEILRDLRHFEEHTLFSSVRDQTGDIADVPDQGTDTLEQEKTVQIATKEGRYLYHLNEALERIRNGTFGICRKCGERIGKERLEAVPHATLCIRCKMEEEEGSRRR